MKKIFVSIFALMILGLPGILSADIGPFSPSPVDLGDLAHGTLWTWRLDGINLAGKTITAATLTFTNISNWDNNANQLVTYMFDTAAHSGTYSATDPYSGINDSFSHTTNATILSLVASGTATTKLDTHSFSTTVVPLYTITFDEAELTALNAYINNHNDVAFGFDPDCHFDNDKIEFRAITASTPEPASIVLLGTCLFAGCMMLRRKSHS
jgi:hypothetical protein